MTQRAEGKRDRSPGSPFLRVVGSTPDDRLGNELLASVASRQWPKSLVLAQLWVDQKLPVSARSAWENHGAGADESATPFNAWFDAYRQLSTDEQPDAEQRLRHLLYRASDDPHVRLLAGQHFAALAQQRVAVDEPAIVEETNWYASTAVRTLKQLASDGHDVALADLAEAELTLLRNYLHHGAGVAGDIARLTEQTLATADLAVAAGRPRAEHHREQLAQQVVAATELEHVITLDS